MRSNHDKVTEACAVIVAQVHNIKSILTSLDHDKDCECAFCWPLFGIEQSIEFFVFELNKNGHTLDE